MRRLYARALASAAAVLAYSEHEAEELRAYLSEHGEAPVVDSFRSAWTSRRSRRPTDAILRATS